MPYAQSLARWRTLLHVHAMSHFQAILLLQASEGEEILMRLLPNNLVDVRALSEMLSVKQGTIYKWVAEGRIPYYRLGRLVRFDPAEVMAWVRQQKGETLQTIELEEARR